MTLILDGKKTAESLKGRILAKTQELKNKGTVCRLAVILVGDDPASGIYANRLVKMGENVGITAEIHRLPQTATQEELSAVVRALGSDDTVQGILPMLPLPGHLSADILAREISPDKDVDAVSPVNAGLVAAGKSRWAPCTPRAVMSILDFYNIPLAGKNAVIIGRSNVVGKPLFHLLLERDATVTVCHSKTAGLADVVRQADIVVAAIGKPEYIPASMIKPGAVVVDVGINEVDGRITGDVNYGDVFPIAGAITPVPGGVGAVSTIMVMEAVLKKYGA